jgi:hypothetical protein
MPISNGSSTSSSSIDVSERESAAAEVLEGLFNEDGLLLRAAADEAEPNKLAMLSGAITLKTSLLLLESSLLRSMVTVDVSMGAG